MDILNVIIAIMLPVGLGFLFKILGVFAEHDTEVLRRFVVKVTVPFIVFRNLFTANMESLNQIMPSVTAMALLTLLFSLTAVFFARFTGRGASEKNAYIFSTFVGNYGYLGWGVMFYFYGDSGFSRSVFFTLFFWPIFLLFGFWLIYLRNRRENASRKEIARLLLANASIPIISAVLGLSANLSGISLPALATGFIDKFAGITIPMILFTIGLSFKLKLDVSRLGTVLLSCAHRLILGYALGLATCCIISAVFPMDIITKKVILMEAVMPTAAMAPFFAEHTDLDKHVQAAIITLSTIISMATIPLWYYVTELIF